MINFGKYNPLSLFFPLGVVPQCGFLNFLVSAGTKLLGSSIGKAATSAVVSKVTGDALGGGKEDSGGLVGNIISTAGNLGSAYLASRGAEKAGDAAAAGAQQGADTIYQQWQETKAQLQPIADIGLPATQEQSALVGTRGAEEQAAAMDRFKESPGYQFRLQRGLGAIDQGMQARGALISGAADKRRMEYASGLASQEFGDYFNRLGAVSGQGLAARQAMAGVGADAAAGQARYQAGAGSELAQGKLGKYEAIQSGIGNLGTGIGRIYDAWRNRG